jgi:hypothetical protein
MMPWITSPSRAVSPAAERAWITKAATVAVAVAHSQQWPQANFQPVSSTFLTVASRTAWAASA